MEKIELLAPSGSIESIYAAVRCGADAVYAGGERFSARANAVNFSDDELKEAVSYCHLHGVKFYQAMNTLVFDDEIRDFLKAAEKSALIGADAFIVQDLGTAKLLRQMIPEMKLNASTQMAIHTKNGALLARELGFSRVVLARELNLTQIEEICSLGIETEVFVHGALCMSVSGQCYMSAVIGSRSANRGLCAQTCRLPFSANGNNTVYDLSLKDLSAVKHIDKLMEIGVSSLKIEGRMKRAEYVAAAALACRAKIDGFTPDTDTLRAVFSRSGFTDGYIADKTGSDMFGIRQKDDVVSADAVLPALREKYRMEKKSVCTDFHINIKRNKKTELIMNADSLNVTVYGDIPQNAVNRPIDTPAISKQLSKLGDTAYELGDITADIDEMLMISASQINALRRDAVNLMNDKIIKKNTEIYQINDVPLNFIRRKYNKKSIRISLFSCGMYDEKLSLNKDIDEIVLPLGDLETECCEKINPNEKIILSPDRFITDEKILSKKLEYCKEKGFKHILCNNISHIKTGKDKGFILHGGYGLNVVNSYSIAELERLGLLDVTVSFECKISQIKKLSANIKIGAVAHGYLPLMLTKNCPLKSETGCVSCSGGIIDRTGRRFKVRCHKNEYTEIFNCDLLVMQDKLNELHTDFIHLDFIDENLTEIENTVQNYKYSKKQDFDSLTRGLYYRGVK